jgi:hypothetical protein
MAERVLNLNAVYSNAEIQTTKVAAGHSETGRGHEKAFAGKRTLSNEI